MAPRKRPGIRRIWQALKAKWKLADERDEALFKLQLKEIEVRDLEERLEAYKDTLVALDRGSRLEGMLYERNLDRLTQPRTAG